jgi:hypothetical protein
VAFFGQATDRTIPSYRIATKKYYRAVQNEIRQVHSLLTTMLRQEVTDDDNRTSASFIVTNDTTATKDTAKGKCRT